MKKSVKLLLVTSLIAVVMLFTLTGCNNTPYQKFLHTNWNDEGKKEVATYKCDIKEGDTQLTGTLVTSIYRVPENSSVTVGEKVLENLSYAHFFEYELNVGEDKVIGQVCFESIPYRPIASFLSKKINGEVKSTFMEYEKNKCIVTDHNNNKTELDINNRTLVFDNVELQAIARTLNFTQNGSLTFQSAITNDTTKIKNIQMGATKVATVNTAKEEGKEPDYKFDFISKDSSTAGFNAVLVLLRANDVPSGLPQTMLVANGEVMVNGETFKQPVLQITEGSKDKGLYTYTLVDLKKEAI